MTFAYPHRTLFRLSPALLSLLALAMLASGCQVGSYLSYALVGHRVNAVYEPVDLPTVILVDDPNAVMGDPAMTGVVASRLAADLQSNKVITQIVEQSRVVALQVQLGEKFLKTPMDQIGRQLGARQVIHVNIDDAMLRKEPGILRPAAKAQVRVFDVEKGQRLFPAVIPGAAVVGGAPGHPLTVTMTYKHAGEDERNVAPILRQKLAQRIGQSAAQLFYNHEVRPGADESEE